MGDPGHMVGTTDDLTICQNQHRQNESVGQVDIPTRVEVHVIWDLTAYQKQHRQNEPAGQVDVPTGV